MKNRLKRFVKKTLVNTSLLKFSTFFSLPGVVILRYHSIQDEPELYANSIGRGIIHSTDEFSEQMELVATKFNPVTLDDILLFANGQKKLPRRPVAITFDDGFSDNLEVAAPVLNRFGIRATFYVTVGSIESAFPPWYIRLRHMFSATKEKKWKDSEGNIWNIQGMEDGNSRAFSRASEECASAIRDEREKVLRMIEDSLDVEPYEPRKNFMLTWDQTRTLQRMGHIVGSHTMTHPNLAYIKEKHVKQELVGSKQRLEEELGAPVIHFSYPSPIMKPHWNEYTIDITKQTGYQTAVTCIQGKVCVGDDPLLLKRTWVPFQRDEFIWYLECTLLGCQL